MSENLKRCPFCGGKADYRFIERYDGTTEVEVGCGYAFNESSFNPRPKCLVKPIVKRCRGNREKSLEIAINDWNTRAKEN